jgi:hypothetical protein
MSCVLSVRLWRKTKRTFVPFVRFVRVGYERAFHISCVRANVAPPAVSAPHNRELCSPG